MTHGEGQLMETRTTIQTGTSTGGPTMLVQCLACTGDVTLDLRTFTVQGAVGEPVGVTYADADIVVWDCPSCSHANADVLTEE